MLRDFIKYVLFHRWNKIEQHQLDFVKRSDFNPSGLHNKLFDYILKINNLKIEKTT